MAAPIALNMLLLYTERRNSPQRMEITGLTDPRWETIARSLRCRSGDPMSTIGAKANLRAGDRSIDRLID
jgi:hypothetical protein